MKSIRKGYDLLKSGEAPYDLPFAQFEIRNNLTIPNSFKRFANNVMLGRDEYYTANFDLLRILEVDSNFIIAIGQVSGTSLSPIIPNIVVDRFITNNRILDEWQDAIESDTLYQEFGLLPIGFLYEPVHSRLFLDTRTETRGNVFCDLNEVLRIEYNKKVEFISSDIWSLIEHCQEEINEELLEKYMDKELVRRWGEDFWRVRSK